MDLRDRPEDVAFRKEVRRLPRRAPGRRVRRAGRPGRLGRRDLRVRGPAGAGRRCWPRTAGPASAGRSSTAAGAPPSPSRSSSTRSTSGPRPRAGSASWARACSARPSSTTAPPSRRPASSRPSVAGTELWCQGYSEPDAGSDLANVQTKAVPRRGRVGGHRPEGLDLPGPPGRLVLRGVPDRAGLGPAQGALLPAGPHGPARRRGPAHHAADPDLASSTRSSSTGPAPASDHVVGEVGEGWRVALATLAFERGVGAARPPALLPAGARPSPRAWPGPTAAAADPVIRQRLAQAPTSSSTILRYNTLRSLSGVDGPVAPPEASIIKLYWATWHRRLGELAMTSWARPADGGRRVPLRARRLPAHLPLQPLRDHLRRLQRDPAQHHRRAGPRPAARAQGGRAETEPRPTGPFRPPAAPAGPPPGTGSWRARSWSSPRRPGPASASPPPSGASRRGRRSSSPTPTSGAWARRPTQLAALPRSGGEPAAGRALQRHRRGAGAARSTTPP